MQGSPYLSWTEHCRVKALQGFAALLFLHLNLRYDGPGEVGGHPAALSLPQCTVTVSQRHGVKAWGGRGVVQSKRKVCLLENGSWLVGWSSCTWLGNLSHAPSLKVFELTSQEEWYFCQLIFPSWGMRQSSTFKRLIYSSKYKKPYLGLK